MKLSKHDFAGTGKVFEFTLAQMFKNKSNTISLLIMFFLAVFSVPVMTFFSGGETKPGKCPVSTVYYWNETEYPVSFDAIGEKDPYFQDITVQKLPFSTDEQYSSLLKEDEILIHLYRDESDGFYYTDLILSDSAKDEDEAYFRLSDTVSNLFDEARFAAAGATKEQLGTVMAQYTSQVSTVSKFMEQDNVGWEAQFAVQYGYAIVVMILFMMSASYIIRAVIEEKASKLVELLMVSVQPLAMILGKIFAVMTYVFGMLFSMAIGFGISYIVTGFFADTSAVWDSAAQMGITPELFNLSPLTVIIVLLFLVLGYFTFSVIAGIAGACCSSMDDVESANMSVVMLVMAGYIVACIVTAFESKVIAVITCIVPIVSIFCAPVQYVCGNVNFAVLCLAWVLQAGVLLALSIFCAKIYRSLIMHRGSRVKLKELLSLAFTGVRKESRS